MIDSSSIRGEITIAVLFSDDRLCMKQLIKYKSSRTILINHKGRLPYGWVVINKDPIIMQRHFINSPYYEMVGGNYLEYTQ